MTSPGATGPPIRVAPLRIEVTTGAVPGSFFGERVITAEAETSGPTECSNVAVIVTVWAPEIVLGAVYSPVLDTSPSPPMAFDQTTAVSDVPVTAAVNCRFCNGARTALEGLTRRLMFLLSGRS